MKNIINEYGEIILLNKNGKQTKVGTLKHGITYNVFHSSAKKICKVTLISGTLEEEFFFFDNGNPSYHLPIRSRHCWNYSIISNIL